MVGVEGEEFAGVEVEGGGDVEDIEAAMAGGGGVAAGEVFGALVNVGPFRRDELDDAGVEVSLQVGEGGVRDRVRVAARPGASVQPDLEADALPEFVEEEAGDGEWLGHGAEVCRRGRESP